MIRISLAMLCLLACNESSTNESESAPSSPSMMHSSLDAQLLDEGLANGAMEDFGNTATDDAMDSLDFGNDESIDTRATDGSTETEPADYTVWGGERITFTKPTGADPTTPEAQDFITENVTLTRGNGNGLYNITQEMRVSSSRSPLGTLWAMGTTADLGTLEFQPLKTAVNNRMRDLPGRDMVLFLIEENIYIDVRFVSWSSGRGNGGGFSYERTTQN